MFYDKGYPVKTIGDVIDRKISRVAKVFDKTDEIQYLDISSIDNSSKTVTGLTPYVLKDAPSRAQYVLKQGDIMYSTVRPNLQNVAINPYSEGNVVGSTGFCVLRCLGVTTGYMWGVVNSVPFTEAMINQASGANYPAVTDKVVHAYEIPIPPKDAQDDYERLVKQSDKSKFTGFKSQFIELFGRPGYDDKGWGLTTLGECCELNPRRSQGIDDALEVSFLAMPSVSEDGHMDTNVIRPYSEVKKGFTYFAENDVLFAKITPCMENGKGAVAEGLSNGIGAGSTEFHVLRPIPQKSNPYWLYIITMFEAFSINTRKVMTGTGGQLRVPISYLKDYPITLPPIELQNEFEKFYRQSDKSK